MRNFSAKVVQGERSAKEKLKDFHFALPSRSLLYPKVVQGERSAKEKLKDFAFCTARGRHKESSKKTDTLPCGRDNGWTETSIACMAVATQLRTDHQARKPKISDEMFVVLK